MSSKNKINKNILSHKNKNFIGGFSKIDLKCKSNDHVFLIRKSKNKNSGSINIKIGNPIKCLIATIYYKNNESKNTVQIQSFGYNKKCSEERNMEHGKGTDAMMKCFIKYIKRKYKNIKNITLTDNAVLNCGKIQIQLSIYYFFKYGKHYYSKFGFVPNFSLEQKKKFEKYKKKYLSEEKNYKKFLFFLKKNITLTNNNKKEINIIFEKLKKYKSIKKFLHKYRFENCKILKTFLKKLLSYFKIKKKILSDNHTFIKQLQ